MKEIIMKFYTKEVLLEKENSCFNPDFLDKPETPILINLTNQFESLHVAE